MGEIISPQDRSTIRELAKRVADIAALPIQAERREIWKQHNSLQPVRPMILLFPEGSFEELLPVEILTCEGEEAKRIEWALRSRIYYHEHLQDDTVIEKAWIVRKTIHNSGWGLEIKRIPSTDVHGAWKFDPVIANPADLEQLRVPDITYDENATMRELEQIQDLFGDILDVQLKGMTRIGYDLMSQYTDWRGLEETMMDMYLQPQMLHGAIFFLEEGHHRTLAQYVDQNLLSPNNDNTYHSSGGNGYTDELPAPGFDPEHVRPCDMWCSAQAQELALVSPRQHAEFSLQYEKRLLEPFGLNGYGCCEDLTHKLDDVLTIPNIRRISISPFADVDACAPQLGGDYIFSWKPHPAHLVGRFDEDRIRSYIRHTIEVAQAHGCVLEMILKDTHTCEHHPERFDRWTQIAREEVTRVST
ncbi:MAG: hypothetical protein E4H27_08380 [Anaerolineales bacterium]|nr:MAG: hypothetical protein E4H27_08380 [Anaerolineales bacterium]